MARRKQSRPAATTPSSADLPISCGIERLLEAALQRDPASLETGRQIVTYRAEAGAEANRRMSRMGLRVADTRDFEGQEVGAEDIGDADALVFGEIGCAVVGGEVAREMTARVSATSGEDQDAIEAIEPEYFAFAENGEYLRGFLSAANTIARDLGAAPPAEGEEEVEAEVAGATWGLQACRVPPSRWSGAGIKVAVLDTGMDLRHPEFAGRVIVSRSFVGQPVQDGNGHGTHCIGTACGPRTPPGSVPRYGIAYGARIYVGKVLTNAGSGSTASVLAGMNWAIANGCQVISMSLGAQTPPQFAYTMAGTIALARGLLIIAAAGNAASGTGAPANSPSIFSVASLDPNLRPSSFSNHGKIEIAAPGRDVYSAWPRPLLHRTISGTSMACPHVAGCAALLAQSSSALRGMALWNRLRATARRLPHPSSRVGAGLVQSP